MANYTAVQVADGSEFFPTYLAKQVTNPSLMVSLVLPGATQYRQRARDTVGGGYVYWTEPVTRGGTLQAPVETLADIVVLDEFED